MIRTLESRLAKLEEIAGAVDRIQVRALPPESNRQSYTERDQRGGVIVWLDATDIHA